jgi:DNA polymerase-3 subunit delta
MFYVFDGDDAFTRREELAALMNKMGDPALRELNTTYLDGRSTTMGEIHHHCSTIPFLADRRLVIVKGLLERLGQRGRSSADAQFLDDLVDYLPHLPPSARLIFVENKALSRRHRVLSLAKRSDAGHTKTFVSPTGAGLVRWARERVKREGGKIERRAVEALCTFVGNDLYQLDQEIQKLIAYTDRQRPITEQDIQLLVPHARQANVFDMVDALGRRDGRRASRLYHDLLDAGEHPLALLGMITRQFRLMIQVKELAPELITPQAIARELGQNPYPIKKILAQSSNYTAEQLRTIHHKLLDTDIEIKTGRIEPSLALDMLIAGLSRVS